MAAVNSTGSQSHSFKVVLLGEGAVGKTSLVLRYVENKFNDKHITTLQVRILQEKFVFETSLFNESSMHTNKLL